MNMELKSSYRKQYSIISVLQAKRSLLKSASFIYTKSSFSLEFIVVGEDIQKTQSCF